MSDDEDAGAGVALEDVTCKHATDKACLCIIDGDEEWIPKSQITDDSEVYDAGHEGTLIVTHWLAEQKGWA